MSAAHDQPEGPPVVAVLGMHRSGTSWLAGTLSEAGLSLGEVDEHNYWNQRGNREMSAIVSLHDRVLSDSGGAWHDPPARVLWRDDTIAELDRIIAAMDAAGETWGFKDPRTVLMLDMWRQRLGGRLRPVGIYRHPGAVALSLARRRAPRFPRVARRAPVVARRWALGLWCIHNEALSAEHRRSTFPLLRFDGDLDRLFEGAAALCRDLGLRSPDAVRDFHDGALVTNDRRDRPVPRRCRPVWDYLVAQT
ncbi:MAG: hypothetical protein RIE08_00095 [Acidimicrobiales bacterium]